MTPHAVTEWRPVDGLGEVYTVPVEGTKFETGDTESSAAKKAAKVLASDPDSKLIEDDWGPVPASLETVQGKAAKKEGLLGDITFENWLQPEY